MERLRFLGRRAAGVFGVGALVLAACSGGGQAPAPAGPSAVQVPRAPEARTPEQEIEELSKKLAGMFAFDASKLPLDTPDNTLTSSRP